ncbi:MAG: ATP-binding protein [Lachnospiraceae bacterium]|nr:ATP-binding protein [Lachnospiraceae bacterium]
MRRLSIKGKVTLWYSLFMLLLTAVVLALLFSLGDQQIIASVQNNLESVVSENLMEIEYDEEDGLETDEDFNFFQNGVYLLLYDEQGQLLAGKLPYSMKKAQTPMLKNGEIQTETIQSVRWMFFDIYHPLDTDESVWVRGIASQSDAEAGLGILLKLAVIILPVFVLAVAAGGYSITCRAFRPVEKIRKTAEEIAGSHDLSRRIHLKGGKDEISQLAETFDQMLYRLEEAFEREKCFTSDASHELRTPVSVIISQSEYSLRHEESSEEMKESLQVILGQAQKMSELIAQLLMLSRADQGRLKLQKEKINLSELVEVIAEEEKERAAKRRIQILTDIEADLYMEGDETLMMRCFMNLIENAIVYGKDEGHIWIGLKKRGETLCGYVKDDGIGIEPEHLPRIWERFYQADPSRSALKGGNSGLGLSFVKWIVEVHGGTVRAESCKQEIVQEEVQKNVQKKVQEGTAFYLEFPQIPFLR